MPSKYRTWLVWNVKEAEELERLLGDTDVRSVNRKFKEFILKGLRGEIGTENPEIRAEILHLETQRSHVQ